MDSAKTSSGQHGKFNAAQKIELKTTMKRNLMKSLSTVTSHLLCTVPLVLGTGCIHSHRRPIVYTPVAAAVVAPPTGTVVERVYPETSSTTVVERPATTVIERPAATIVETPSTTIVAPPSAVVGSPTTILKTPSSGPVIAGSDIALMGTIRNQFDTEPTSPGLRNVQITVDDGRVVLRGTVPTEHERQELRARIARLAGVRGVDDRLTVELH